MPSNSVANSLLVCERSKRACANVLVRTERLCAFIVSTKAVFCTTTPLVPSAEASGTAGCDLTATAPGTAPPGAADLRIATGSPDDDSMLTGDGSVG